MRWDDLAVGDVLISKRTERVHLVLDVDLVERGDIVRFGFLSLGSGRIGAGYRVHDDEIEHYEVLRA